ncbi:MAG TPA: ankyrin repeat domain-containing protein [Pyrinomonadaceae bacterium]|nr:ankyrin repeat domain-containing protein [Pyrinomonadaceae bacterium]
MQTRRTILPLLLLLLAAAATGARAQGPDAKQALNDKLWEAARVGDAASVRALLDQGADVNAKFRYGQTALFKAAERGHTEVIKLLLQRGADANVKDTFYGDTALSRALDKLNFEAVRALLAGGADGVDDVLLKAVRGGHAELAGIALARGGLKPETLTVALVAATSDEKLAALADLLRKAGARPPLEVDTETLQTYAGSYKSEAGTLVSVSVKDGRLLVMGPAGPPFAIVATTDKTSFRPHAFDGTAITFNVEGGKATSFSLIQGSRTTVFKRVEQ